MEIILMVMVAQEIAKLKLDTLAVEDLLNPKIIVINLNHKVLN